MKKMFLLVFCLILFSSATSFVFADNENPNPVDSMATPDAPAAQDYPDDDTGENAQIIYEQYGSIYSPYFNNNEYSNPSESNYGYSNSGNYE